MRLERWTSPSGTQRWLTTLDRSEARAYVAAVRVAIPGLPTGPRSYAGASRPGRPWQQARLAWRRAVAAEMSTASLVIVSDVAACYPSIGEGAIRMVARHAGGAPEPLLSQLARLGQIGVRGLPVGPDPSAWMAEAILAIADERARMAGTVPIRWVDDVVFAGDRDQVRRAARAWASALRELGLCENETKRHTLTVASGTSAISTSLARPAGHGIIRTS